MMKRAKPVASIDEYIRSCPAGARTKLREMRKAIRAAAPGAEEAIRYQVPTFRLNGNVVHFAAFSRHIGFYPTPGGIAAFKRELGKYKLGKGSVQFPLDKPLPIALIKKIVRFRVTEILRKR